MSEGASRGTAGSGWLAGLAVQPLAAGEGAAVFTVDVEDWYHANFRSAPALDTRALPHRVEPGVDALLQLLADAGATGTFFVLGCVARDHPQLVPRIAAAGHEIACHGMQHDLVYEQTPEAFGRAAREARSLLADQSGQPVLGFRSPSWSLTERSLWAFEVLAECGFRYDSSVFPAANYLYGIDGAPTRPYVVRTRAGAGIVEVPPSVLALGPRRFGVGGGFYLRVLPLWVHLLALRRHLRRGAPFLSYVHPREFDPDAHHLRLPLSWTEQQIHRFAIGGVHRRVERLLGATRWCSIEQLLRRRGLVEEVA